MRDLDKQIGNLRAEQASAWVSELSKPDTGQHKAFVEWLKESQANVREFLIAHAIDQSLEQLDSQRRVDIDSLLAQINPRVTSLVPAESALAERESTRVKPHREWRYLIAAGIACVALVSGWAVFERQSSWQEFQTGTGEQRALQMEDGSVVHLNAHSRIALNFSGTARDVKLIEGEALFDVHHDPRPFRVFTRDAVIRDIGTRFNVHSRSDGVRVAVIQGSVELTALPTADLAPASTASIETLKEAATAEGAESHIITADREAQVDRNGVVTVGAVPDISEVTAWWQRRLVYRSETLAHIVEDFNRYNRRRIRLEGDDVMKRSYTGVFGADDPDSLAQVLASDPELLVERQGDNTIVVRAR
jgi:transmembrane sensor